MVPGVLPAVTVMELVVEEPVQPGGNVQVYVVPATFGTLYVSTSLGQKVGTPLMAPGCGAPTST
jgi:hypothetical protein